MTEKLTAFSIRHTFPVKPDLIYTAWLNGDLHSAMTGGWAEGEAIEGKNFTAWDGYISGKNIKLIPSQKIVQSWRTTEFKDTDQDSRIEIELQEVEQGCLFILKHKGIPEGQPDYEQGWKDHYIKPMSHYFK